VALAAALLAFFCLATVLFYMLGRFRVPAVPWICGFGGFALARLLRGWQESRGGPAKSGPSRRRAGPWPVLAALALSALAVNFAYEAYRNHLEVRVMRWVRPDGVKVDLADRTVLRDNGPHSFGGWFPVEVPEGDSLLAVRKEFATAPDAGSKGNPALRLAVLAPSGGTLELRSGGAALMVAVPAGLRWLTLEEVPLNGPEINGNTKPASAPGRRAVEVALRRVGTGGPVYLLFDTQRDYGRTAWSSGGKPPGEWVADLVLTVR
jgi:hypothetical protein